MADSSAGSSSVARMNLNLTLSSSHASPRIRLAPALLRDLNIGAGEAAVLRLIRGVDETHAANSSSTTHTEENRWIAGAIWPYDAGAHTSKVKGTPSKSSASFTGRSQDGELPNCLYAPFGHAAQPDNVKVEVVRASGIKSSPVSKLKLELAEVITNGTRCKSPKLDRPTRDMLGILAKEVLVQVGYLLPGQRIALSFHGSDVILQVVSSANSAAPALNDVPSVVLSVSRLTEVSVRTRRPVATDSEVNRAKEVSAKPSSDVASSSARRLGGLDAEVKQLREMIFLPLMRPELFTEHGLQPPRGVLLHGPPGTGKTSLALSISSSFLPPSQIFTISGPELSSSYHGRTESRIRKVFQDARKHDMAVIIMDEIDVIAGNREGENDGVGSRVVATLLTEIDGVGQQFKKKPGSKESNRTRQNDTSDDSQNEEEVRAAAPQAKRKGGKGGRVVVIAATNRPNVIDPALRRPGRLDKEIEIGVPNASARLDILQTLLSGTPHELTSEDIHQVASRAHGFVGADLTALVREAGMRVIRRRLAAEATVSDSSGLAGGVSQMQISQGTAARPLETRLQLEDLLAALPLMRPSSLRSMLPPPPLSWSSIGLGSADSPYSKIKSSIHQTVEWPLRYGDKMKKLGISGGKGVLLYGPPGCSKTMIARACAQSEGINWIGVKGPELFSKYLGDSEKAVRDLFRKARAAAPTILFFDEIDALTTTRSASGSEDGGASAVSDRVIASFLTEMDGADALEKVVVIAATNRPEVIDPAMLRPGRLDTLLYVGPPDISARRSILEIRRASMATDPALDLDKIASLTEGCSGAEVVAVCQDAGVRAMTEDLDAPFVAQRHFETAALGMRRRITADMVRRYEAWRDQLSA